MPVYRQQPFPQAILQVSLKAAGIILTVAVGGADQHHPAFLFQIFLIRVAGNRTVLELSQPENHPADHRFVFVQQTFHCPVVLLTDHIQQFIVGVHFLGHPCSSCYFRGKRFA